MSNTKVAIITGSSRGIGAAIAKRLARDGFAVVVNYASRRADADQVVAEVVAGGGKAIGIQADVANPEETDRLFEIASSEFGGVDILVNNAGVMSPGLTSLGETDDAWFDRMVAINLKGTFNGMRLAAKQLRSGGRVVNLSSTVVGLFPPGYSVYAATKAAVEAMTAIFAKELRGRNITVNAVAPGPTETELFLTGKTPQQLELMAKMAPLERLGTPEEIAGVVAFLVGSDGGWVNGQTIRANGGIA